MPLTPGARLGPYEILNAIGAGGMGEIYKAKDTRLDRVVAVKVISSLVAGGPELRERFEREARAVSQLNHPHICTLHDVGHEQGTEYLVLEFLDGESLADRLQQGALPLDQATRIAIQICDALDKAHRAGIIHRDLKPGNVFLVRGATASAPPTAKLLDFGLAKSSPVAPASSGGINLTSPPTVTTPLTAHGTILGTFQYMAPEQLEGEEADARTDIWAFGCLLYEMLTGRKAFAGRTHASLISSIMSAQPAPVMEFVPQAPPVIDHVIRTCTAKDPAERFQTAHDLLLQLRWIASGSGTSQPAVAPAGHSSRGRRPMVLFAGGIAAAAIASAAVTWYVTRPVPSPPPSAVRATFDLPPDTGYGLFATNNIALSPDGKRVVYLASGQQSSTFMRRDLEQFGPGVEMPGTTDAIMPFFSHDGAWLGFVARGKLQKIPAGGGAAIPICDMIAPYGAAWAPDDTIVFTDVAKGVLMRVSSSGGEPKPITSLEKGETAHRWPDVLPDGSVLFAANSGTNWSDSRIVVQPADGRARRTVLDAGSTPRYLASGHLAILRAGTLYVVPFDVRTLTATGAPRQLADSVSFNESDGRAHYAVARNGTLVYAVAPQAAVSRTLVWVSRDGKVEPVGLEQRAYDHPRISPDGRRLALTIRGQNPDVWVADLERKTLTRFTFDPGEEESGVWTPDGKRITFAASRGSTGRMTFWKAADSSGVEEQLFASKSHNHLGGWTPDGRTLVSEEIDGTFGLYTGTTGDKTVKPYLQTQFNEVAAQVSPNGEWIAYSSNESGHTQVFVQAFPGPGSRQQISVDGGTEPKWARSGRELFYRLGDRMMVVPIEYTPTVRAGAARILFKGEFARVGWGQANYDVSPDGSRFLMIQGEEQDLPTQIRLVVNWFDELRR
jgi:serine/threonine protein kinase/Tol biopolymer transport system component